MTGSPGFSGRGAWLTARPRGAVGRRDELAALVLYAFVLVVRAPWVLPRGSIFGAEEATVHSACAWPHPSLARR